MMKVSTAVTCRGTLQVVAILSLLGANACTDDDPGNAVSELPSKAEKQGVLTGVAVSGLDYSTASKAGVTDEEGHFDYKVDETVSFAIGKLALGSASGGERLGVADLTPGASGLEDQRVTNLLVLLQTLDRDGDLNDGIRITPEIAAIVSEHAEAVELDQAPEDFAKDERIADLLAALNRADVLTDTDPRERKLRGATAAREYWSRATGERKQVETQYGEVKGFAPNATTWQWLGVPYGKPPLGALRWKPTQEPDSWSKPRDAVAWADQAPQDPRFEATGEGGMSEDCLYLNVTAPRDARDLPVMVWFHGGSFTILTSNSRSYNNADALTTKDVVLVTVNHRLGPFGYLNHPQLVEDSEYGGSGNYGQIDLVRALEWVRDNIAAFGGDPSNVTIFGQSGGCGKVSSLMISPLAKGLFHKAACHSGTSAIASDASKQSVIAAAENVGKALFERIGANSVEEARALPWTAIVQADIDNAIPRETYRPAIDNYYLSKTFYESVRDGQESDVPLMIGSTDGDYPYLRSGLRDVMPFRGAHSRSDLFDYKFSRVPAGWTDRVQCGHGGELPYLFNYPPMFVNNYLFDLVLDPSTGKRLAIEDLDGDGVSGTDGDVADILASERWDDSDAEYAQTVMTMWSNFAKTGNPSTPELDWTPYTPENDTYVELGATGMEIKTGLAAAFP